MQEHQEGSTKHSGKVAAGAAAAQRGFDYQRDVSVLAALQLLLISHVTDALTLEPENDEDMEANLALSEPGSIMPIAQVFSGQKLVMQVKLDNGDPWSLTDVKRILTHGKRRKPARDLLADTSVRYLLVTNAGCAGGTKKIEVEGFLEQPDTTDFPASLRSTLPHAPEGRVAIWGTLTESLLKLEIDRAFSLLKIPLDRQDDCLQDLRSEAKRRSLGYYGGVWLGTDLQTSIGQFGGSWSAVGDLELFVAPSNFPKLLDLLEKKNAVILAGPSGIGKTWSALALCDAARKSEPTLQLQVVESQSSPSNIRVSSSAAGPTLVYIEDPWGQYSVYPSGAAWAAQLPSMLRAAKPGLRYVITSRSDMLSKAGASQDLAPWLVEPETEHYANGEIEKIYENNIPVLPPDMQLKALTFQQRVLGQLNTPFELSLYFSLLRQGPLHGEIDPAFLNRVLANSHREAVEGVVVHYLASGDSSGAPAQIWALLAARGSFDRTQLASIQHKLRLLDPALAGSLGRTTDRMIGTRHLRQPFALISFSHPSVRAGFEKFMQAHWYESEHAIEQLIKVLISLPEGLRPWGVETAAHVVESMKELADRNHQSLGEFPSEPSVQAELDIWLETALLDDGADFSALLRLASNVGSTASVPCALTRWLVQGFQRGADCFNEHWSRFEVDDAWFDRIRADSRTFAIVSRFIRVQLPQDDGDYGDDFPAQLRCIAAGLEPAFTDAAHSVVGYGHLRTARMIAREAVADLQSYLSVVEAALDDLYTIDIEGPEEKPVSLRIADGEVDEGTKDYYEDYYDDSGASSIELIEAYVRNRRAAGAWQDLEMHPRASELALIWAQCAGRSTPAPCEAELVAIFTASKGDREQREAWSLAQTFWFSSLESRLIAQVVCFGGDDELRWAAVRCAYSARDPVLGTCFQIAASEPASLVRLIVDIYGAMRADEYEQLRDVLGEISAQVLEIFDALVMRDCAMLQLGAATRALLVAALETACAYVVAAIAHLLFKSGDRSSGSVRKWIQAAVDPDDARTAVAAAIALGDDVGVQMALAHPRADAREAALVYLAASAKVPLPPELLLLADDPGSRVRMALMRRLRSKPHPDHFPVVMALTMDSWDSSTPRYNESPSYPIARQAVHTLDNYPDLSDEAGYALIRLATASKDYQLKRKALQCAVSNCNLKIQEAIWEMVQSHPTPDMPYIAADALANSRNLAGSVLEGISRIRLDGHTSWLALSLIRLISMQLEIEIVLQRLEQLAQQPSQRALLLVAIVALRERDRAAAEQVCRLLGPDHPVWGLLNAPKAKLPRSALNDLGDVRVRQAILSRMNELFERN
jgi:hypothetical protein